jgi:RecA/RadA recombinase
MADTPGAIATGASGDDAGRALTGILGLDDVLAGGLPRDRLYLVEGTPGTGKTTLALQFLVEGQRRDQRGMYVTHSETAGELRASEGAAPFFPLGPAISPAMSCGLGGRLPPTEDELGWSTGPTARGKGLGAEKLILSAVSTGRAVDTLNKGPALRSKIVLPQQDKA